MHLDFGTPAEVLTGPLDEELRAALSAGFDELADLNRWQPAQHAALETLAASRAPRLT